MTFTETALAALARETYEGYAYRHQEPGFDPLSGEGARRGGGRFNPPDAFPVLYLCETRPCAVAELRGLSNREGTGLEGLLPRHLYRYRVRLSRVVDLTDDGVLEHLDVPCDALTASSWQETQRIGATAYRLGWQGVISRSDTSSDRIVAVFPELVGGDVLDAEIVERWEHPDDL